MPRQQRIALVVAAVAVAVVAFLVLRPSDDDSDKAASTTTTPAETTAGSTSTAPAPTAKPKQPVQRIRISGGKPAGGVKKIDVKKGDRVVLNVTSTDTSDNVHLHGYDIERELAPGKPVKMTFTAKIDGIFEIELENSKTQIAELKVEP